MNYRYYMAVEGKAVELIKHGESRYPEGHPLLKECIGQLALQGMEYESELNIPEWTKK